MSLVLTELTNAGVAMVADSAISMLRKGRISTVDQQQWKKLLKVDRICAGISYWGSIGYITPERFDNWLERKIRKGEYTDLPSFADYLAAEMNQAAGGKPLPNEQAAGIHVAGFHQWARGVRLPTFYHIHNGHGHVEFEQKIATVDGRQVPVETKHHYVWAARGLFSRHNDFSPEHPEAEALINTLKTTGYSIRNGDYAPFIIIAGGLKNICDTLNTIPGVSVPRYAHVLEPRVGFLKIVMETVINIYKCSSMSKVIGGKVMSLGIKPDGTYL
jgi:hypothetical protein